MINIPRNRKEIQSFLGKINFLRRFIPNFDEIVKLIIDMLKEQQNKMDYRSQSILRAC
jgi:hypothetical protein